MDALLYLVPLIMAGIAIVMAAAIVRRSAQMRRAWRSGLTARARCLRTYTTTSGRGGDRHHHVSTTLHHVYEFVTREGRTVRFEEENGPGTIIEGDVVTVYYAPERPERATAHAPRPVANTLVTVAVLGFLGLIVAFCLFFVSEARAFSDDFGWGDGVSVEDDPAPDVPWDESDPEIVVP
ncbi:DUF3592 domain-containing protein [Streptomyces spectabilis]|uniref:DUF3592 domain-containing protein n=1 Tax=Streptomyces spectabilis TaxID=68270 RepID=A0A5P2X592_STRST|nr:DUF3592 domain-containing protein [Streptomyces spectabilis]MBB5106299.1 hypothetical protein [Streptomyces spectabilis]MCI3902912.1 DUF3592 domain-containing protein [Streptomyces spectabilis]QEV60187.1 DUF3592 domain-containing protein [Streptomyces spectabilis]